MTTNWISVKDKKPYCPRNKEALGTEVLVWPLAFSNAKLPAGEYVGYPTAFYGRKCTGKPAFYLHGVVLEVTHWMPLPEVPKK